MIPVCSASSGTKKAHSLEWASGTNVLLKKVYSIANASMHHIKLVKLSGVGTLY